MELTDLWGVAGRFSARLKAINIETPIQLRDAEPRFLRERIGVVMERMALELRGTPCQALALAVPENKTILASRSFDRAVTERHELEEAVSSHVARAAEKLRRQRLVAGVVMVFVMTNPFRPQDRQYVASRSIDRINETHGRDTIRLAVAGVQRGWCMKSEQRSPNFTTAWDELLRV